MYMDEDAVADLKQFITGLMSQQLAALRDELRKDIERVESKLTNQILRVESKLEKKIDNLSAAVAEAIDSSNEETASQIKNHERRIVKLERKLA